MTSKMTLFKGFSSESHAADEDMLNGLKFYSLRITSDRFANFSSFEVMDLLQLQLVEHQLILVSLKHTTAMSPGIFDPVY